MFTSVRYNKITLIYLFKISYKESINISINIDAKTIYKQTLEEKLVEQIFTKGRLKMNAICVYFY